MLDKISTISTDRTYWRGFFPLCCIWVSLLWQNSLFLALCYFPVIKSDAGIHRGYISMLVLFYIRSYILLHTIKLNSFLSQSAWNNLMPIYLWHSVSIFLQRQVSAVLLLHTQHIPVLMGCAWLAVTTAGQGPGNGCPFPTHWEEETFCQHLNSSFPLNLRYHLPADRNIFIDRFTCWMDQKERCSHQWTNMSR